MPSLRESLTALYELQLIDNENMDNFRQLRKLQKHESESCRTFRSFQTQIEKLEKKLEPMRATAKELEDKLTTLEEKKKLCEEKLYDPNTNQKELIFLQKEREQIKSIQKSTEEEKGKYEYEIQNIATVCNDVRAQMEQLEPKVKDEIAQKEAEQEQIQLRIAELREKRMTFKNFENKELLLMYQNIQKENGGVAIVPVEEGICEGCGIEAPLSTMKELENSDEIVRCQLCGRIQFLPL